MNGRWFAFERYNIQTERPLIADDGKKDERSRIKSSDHFDLGGDFMCSRCPYDHFLDATLTVVDSHTARQHGLLDGVCWVRELFDSAPRVVERHLVRKFQPSRLRWV
jgi:hypothetical protein